VQRSLTAALRRRGAILTLAATCSLLAGATAWSRGAGPLEPPGPSAMPLDPPTATHPALRILWDQEMLSDPSPAMDVRWASDRSVYVAWLRHGASELALDGKFTVVRNLFPDASSARYQPFDFLAASSDYIVASSNALTLGFRPRPHGEPTGEVSNVLITRASVGSVEAVDLSGNRLLLIGMPNEWATDTAGIAWLGPLTRYPARDLKPVLSDVAGVARSSLLNCRHLMLGAVRFLPDGTFLVVPGFQPGAHLFDAAGRLLRTWDTHVLGLDGDTGCPGITMDQRQEIAISGKARSLFLNRYRVLDGVLPLPQGPGLIIRSVAGGKVHWQLVVLQGAGAVVYDVPLTGTPPYDRLRGDVLGSRIVLLLGPHEFDKFEKGQPHVYKTTHLYVAELPRVLEPPVQADQERGRS